MPIEQDDSLLETARKRRAQAQAAWSEIYREMTADLKMCTGKQWTEEVLRNRQEANRPALTFNRLHTNVQLVANGVRQNSPAIKICPVSNGADEVSAKVQNGIIRYWNYQSQGDVARDHAVKMAASGGIGFYRIRTDYSSDEGGFDQDCFVDRNDDPATVHFDPFVRKFDFSDARWCFVESRMPWEDYRAEFPDAATQSFEELSDSKIADWGDEDAIVVAEYWYVETKKRRWVQLADGTQGFFDDLVESGQLDKKPEKGVIVNERIVKDRTVCQKLINGVEVLKTTTWLGKWIPIIPVLGEETYVDGKRKIASLVRYVHDAQKLLNAYQSGIAEAIGLHVRVPWIAPKGTFKSDQNWSAANTTNPAFLEYDVMYDESGQQLPGPQRQAMEPQIQALSAAAAQTVDGLKAGMGIFDSSLGAAQAEYSGVSVQKRTQQADVINYHFQDNLARAMWQEGRIYLDLIPKLIDTPRAMQIMDQDGTISEKLITQALADMGGDGNAYSDKPYSTDPSGPRRIPGREKEEHHHIDVGKYAVRIITGPGYTTKRQEEFETWSQLAQNVPQIWAAAADIIIRSSDFEGKDQIADSVLALMPEPIQMLRKGNQPLPPEVQAQMAQAKQAMDAMQAENMQLKFEKAAKVVDNQAKAAMAAEDRVSDFQMQQFKGLIDILGKEITAGVDIALGTLTQEVGAIKHSLEMLHESELAPDPAIGNLGMHPDKPLPPPEMGAQAAGGPTQ